MKVKIRETYKTATPSFKFFSNKSIFSLVIKNIVRYNVFYV